MIRNNENGLKETRFMAFKLFALPKFMSEWGCVSRKLIKAGFSRRDVSRWKCPLEARPLRRVETWEMYKNGTSLPKIVFFFVLLVVPTQYNLQRMKTFQIIEDNWSNNSPIVGLLPSIIISFN